MSKIAVFSTIILSVMLAACVGERPQSIDNPAIEATLTGIYSIERIEHADTETLVTLKSTFMPKWYVQFTKSCYLEVPETGERLHLQSMDNGEMGKRIFMPESGDSVFIFHFPPLEKTVEKVNFGYGENPVIFGISLRKTQKQGAAKIPANVKRWLNNELRASKNKDSWDLSPESFFHQDTARVVGYIKGYHPHLGFKTAIVYSSNEIVRTEFPTVVEIHPDGRFEANIPLLYPTKQSIAFEFENMWLPIYIEPGRTLGMVVDWQDFLDADRYRNRRGRFRRTEFFGPLARLNTELAAYDVALDKDTSKAYKEFQKQYRELRPEEFKVARIASWDGEIATLEQYIAGNDLLPATKKLLRADIDVENATFMYDYLIYRESEQTEAAKAPVPDNFYDFIHRLDMNDPAILVPHEAGTFINRFEFADPFIGVWRSVTLPGGSDQAAWDEAIVKNYIEELDRRDSVVTDFFGLQRSLVTQITNARTVSHRFERRTAEMAGKYLSALKNHVTDDFLRAQLDSYYSEVFADREPEELPDNTAGRVFRDIIAPFEGKLLIVDFWAVTCGPCIYGIEHSVDLRKEYEDSPDVEFLFITSEDESPLDRYNDIVEKNGMTHSFRLNCDDYLYLRELFRFNGIPRYALIDRCGRIIDRKTHDVYTKKYIEDLIEKHGSATE